MDKWVHTLAVISRETGRRFMINVNLEQSKLFRLIRKIKRKLKSGKRDSLPFVIVMSQCGVGGGSETLILWWENVGHKSSSTAEIINREAAVVFLSRPE